MFFVTGMVKLLLIAALFLAARRLSGTGVLFFIQGLLMIYLGLLLAGLRPAVHGSRHGT